VATVTERIGTAKVRCAEKIKGWNGDKRKTYFDSLKASTRPCIPAFLHSCIPAFLHSCIPSARSVRCMTS
jgi:hypothetical protein